MIYLDAQYTWFVDDKRTFKGWGGCYSTQNIRNVRLISWSSNEIVVYRETVKLKPWELSGSMSCRVCSPIPSSPFFELLNEKLQFYCPSGRYMLLTLDPVTFGLGS